MKFSRPGSRLFEQQHRLPEQESSNSVYSYDFIIDHIAEQESANTFIWSIFSHMLYFLPPITAVALTSLSKYRQHRNAVETEDDCVTELWQQINELTTAKTYELQIRKEANRVTYVTHWISYQFFRNTLVCSRPDHRNVGQQNAKRILDAEPLIRWERRCCYRELRRCIEAMPT